MSTFLVKDQPTDSIPLKVCPSPTAEAIRRWYQAMAGSKVNTKAVMKGWMPFAQWGNIFDSTTVATAIADRLVFNSEILVMEGKSYRKKAD